MASASSLQFSHWDLTLKSEIHDDKQCKWCLRWRLLFARNPLAPAYKGKITPVDSLPWKEHDGAGQSCRPCSNVLAWKTKDVKDKLLKRIEKFMVERVSWCFLVIQYEGLYVSLGGKVTAGDLGLDVTVKDRKTVMASFEEHIGWAWLINDWEAEFGTTHDKKSVQQIPSQKLGGKKVACIVEPRSTEKNHPPNDNCIRVMGTVQQAIDMSQTLASGKSASTHKELQDSFRHAAGNVALKTKKARKDDSSSTSVIVVTNKRRLAAPDADTKEQVGSVFAGVLKSLSTRVVGGTKYVDSDDEDGNEDGKKDDKKARKRMATRIFRAKKIARVVKCDTSVDDPQKQSFVDSNGAIDSSGVELFRKFVVATDELVSTVRNEVFTPVLEKDPTAFFMQHKDLDTLIARLTLRLSDSFRSLLEKDVPTPWEGYSKEGLLKDYKENLAVLDKAIILAPGLLELDKMPTCDDDGSALLSHYRRIRNAGLSLPDHWIASYLDRYILRNAGDVSKVTQCLSSKTPDVTNDSISGIWEMTPEAQLEHQVDNICSEVYYFLRSTEPVNTALPTAASAVRCLYRDVEYCEGATTFKSEMMNLDLLMDAAAFKDDGKLDQHVTVDLFSKAKDQLRSNVSGAVVGSSSSRSSSSQ